MRKIIEIRELDETPFDKKFNNENCHATGVQVCFEGDDPNLPRNWWNEYMDSDGEFWYGR